MTDQRDGAQCAHLCPRGEFSWFVGNNMMSYNKNRYLSCDDVMDDLNNAIGLRSDLHTHFDRRIFAFVPKALKTDKTPRYVSHVLQITGETGPLYHNAFIYPIDVPREFLFARFAWAIFPSLESFLISGSERLLLVNQDGSEVPKNVSANECFELAGPSRSVSRSRNTSRKRKARSTPQKSNIGVDSRESTPYSQHKRQQLSSTESPTSNSNNQQHFQPLKEPALQIQRTTDWAMSESNDPRGENWDRLGPVDELL
ncbi:MAG: hypothetical protein M1813_000739 [Trichoglossum hirsutum]|nr:MAG: hypothetical protein M1813_000739 [Trichoglossum hirsutum]